MTPEELSALATEAKTEYEKQTQDIENKLDKARVRIKRLEVRLTQIREQYQVRIAQLTASFVGLPTADPAALTAKSATEPAKARRGSLDEPIFALARELVAAGAPDVSSRDIGIAWRNTSTERLTDSTIRSVLERLAKNDLLEITAQGGGKGSGKPRRYRPKQSPPAA